MSLGLFTRIQVQALFLAILLLCCQPPALAGDVFQELDSILLEAGGVAKFVEDTPQAAVLRERYFEVLKNYYGEKKFGRPSFDKIVSQLRVALAEIPDLEAKLWSTEGLGHRYSFTVPMASSGLDLKPEGWTAHLDAVEKRLEEEAGRLLQLPESERRVRMQEIRTDWQRRYAEYQAAYQQAERLPARARREREAALARPFRETIERDPGYRELAAYEYLQELRGSNLRALTGEGAADFALLRWDEFLSGRLPSDAGRGEERMSAELSSFGRKLFFEKLETPALEVVDKQPLQNALFRVRTLRASDGSDVPEGRLSGTFEAVPIQRRFHGIWRGIPINECVGGGCDHLANTTPRRWALAAIENVQIHHLEKDGSYHGYVQMIPIVERSTGHTYGAIDVLSGSLAQRVPVLAEDGVSTRLEPLLRTWLRTAYQKMPVEWKGLVAGDNTSVNNTKGQTALQASQEYLLAEPIHGELHLTRANFAEHFRVGSDEFVAKLLGLLPDPKQEGPSKHHPGLLTFDASLTNGGLYLLHPDPAVVPSLEAQAKVFRELESCLQWSSCTVARATTLLWSTERMAPTEELGRILQKYALLTDKAHASLRLFAIRQLEAYPKYLPMRRDRLAAAIKDISAYDLQQELKKAVQLPEYHRFVVETAMPRLLEADFVFHLDGLTEATLQLMEETLRASSEVRALVANDEFQRRALRTIAEYKLTSHGNLYFTDVWRACVARRMALAAAPASAALPRALKQAVLDDLHSLHPVKRECGVKAVRTMATRGPLDRHTERELAIALAKQPQIAGLVEEVKARTAAATGKRTTLYSETFCQRAYAAIPRTRYIVGGVTTAAVGWAANQVFHFDDQIVDLYYGWDAKPNQLWPYGDGPAVARNTKLEVACAAAPRRSARWASDRKYNFYTQRNGSSYDASFRIGEWGGNRGDRIVVLLRKRGDATPIFSEVLTNTSFFFRHERKLGMPRDHFSPYESLSARVCVLRGGDLIEVVDEDF